MKWIEIKDISKVPVDTPLCVGAFISFAGAGHKFLWFDAIINDEGTLTDSEGEETLGWYLEDFGYYCILPDLPKFEMSCKQQ